MEKLEQHRPAVAQELHTGEKHSPANVPPSAVQTASKPPTIQ